MARASRLAGAILLETGNDYYLVGNTKEPCDFSAAGFETPPEIDAARRPLLRLCPIGAPPVPQPPYLLFDLEGEDLARRLAERLLIHRNGSVSERLWGLVSGSDPDTGQVGIQPVPCQWLVEIPSSIWSLVRDQLLRCL